MFDLYNCIELVKNQTNASLTLSRKVSSDALEKNKNLVFSPLSLNLMVGMIAAGTSGETRQELFKYLKQDSIDDINKLYTELVSIIFADGSSLGGPKLAIANSVWIQEGVTLKDSFKQVVDNVYKSSFYSANFEKDPEEARLRVNSWGEERTNGLIKEVLPPNSISNMTRLILANALYFKGVWSDPFDPIQTQENEFHLLDGKTIEVPFMRSYEYQNIGVFDGFKVLGLPYEDGQDTRRFSIYIFLPDSKDGLYALMEKLWSESGFVEEHLPCERVPVGNFRVPKFKITFEFEASTTLEQLGLELPFTPFCITEMVNSALHVSGIHHKSYIEVNEQGTEAAAVTEADCDMAFSLFGDDEPPRKRVDFVADHPFVFAIRENTSRALLFVGHVVNPLQG